MPWHAPHPLCRRTFPCDGPGGDVSALEAIAGDPNLANFYKALNMSSAEGLLGGGGGNLTVFAPSNNALARASRLISSP